MKLTGYFHLLIILLLATIFNSCKPISYSDYAMEPYSGRFNWNEVTKKAAWSNRIDHAAVVFKGKIWVLGGYDSGRMKGDTYLEDVWNSSNGKDWTLVTDDAPWKGRRGHTVTVFNDGTGDALYLIGGFEVDEKTGYRQYTNDVWKSTDGINWTQIKKRTYPIESMNSDFMPRFNHICLTNNRDGKNYLYLIGGSTMIENTVGAYSFLYLHDVWRSENGIDWIKLDNTDFGQRSELAGCVDPNTGRMYIHGGTHSLSFDNDSLYNQPGKYYYNVWHSDDGATWVADTSFSLLRAAHSMIYYRNTLWLFPGKDDSYKEMRFAEGDLFYTYRKEEDQPWELDSRGSKFSARHSYATVAFEDKIWVLGGETADNGPNNDVWCGTIGN